MKIFIGYDTSEGQSRKIARWISDRLVAAGESVELLNLKDGDGLEVGRFDRAILISPIHAGHYGKGFVAFVADQAKALGKIPTLFLSVSLGAGGHDADDWKTLKEIVDDVCDATDWTPSATEHVAGAYMPSKYDLLTRFIMRRIVAEKDPNADLKADKEYTDWDALAAKLDAWLES